MGTIGLDAPAEKERTRSDVPPQYPPRENGFAEVQEGFSAARVQAIRKRDPESYEGIAGWEGWTESIIHNPARNLSTPTDI